MGLLDGFEKLLGIKPQKQPKGTRDNQITNQMVRRGQLPANQAEIYPQRPGMQVQPSGQFQGGASAYGHNRDMARELQQRGYGGMIQRQGYGGAMQGGGMGIPYSMELGDFGDDEGIPIQGGHYDTQNINQLPRWR